jgi:2-methylcitrate dehydratase PrpD
VTGATREVAEWAATLTYEAIPERIHPRTKAQILSVAGAIHAGRHSEPAGSALEVARTWGTGAEATVLGTGERLPRPGAIFANACASVAFDFDDYLFAGHTGHSAVCAALAYAEAEGGSGRDVLATITAANEVAGRLGAALLLGPHNGQMWAYIHLLGGAVAAGRFLGLDPGRMQHAIGVAFTAPPYPLMPAFMGPDSKLLVVASPTLDGCRGAELAARGWTGAPNILEDPQGFLAKFNPDHYGWMLSGLGRAWVSDSLTYKVVPGCAYIDTAVDAFTEVAQTFEREHGRRPAVDDVEGIEVRCGMFTSGMESFSAMYRSPDRLQPISVNFSVALSLGLMLVAGELGPRYLSHKYLDANRDAIFSAASKVRLEHDPEMDRLAGKASEEAGFSLRSLLGAEHSSLEDVSFEGYRMAFPAAVSFRSPLGTYESTRDVPLGGAGRPWDETENLVRQKFLDNAPDAGRAREAVAAVDELEGAEEVRDIIQLLATGA